ncbi:wiskott-Aldrich syndrome protein homolog 1-like [Centrocercus urophasianus]|uniref:wiskott-Aldrich syndrome protein homolog 1-like n=1 Tax=Centrocercus urophasianus TaxID=9002 RepID=UPI001C64A47D|nr:wiskott-Aldrich syndrome protein homolog 1-like [Centrocercus urophasianus]
MRWGLLSLVALRSAHGFELGDNMGNQWDTGRDIPSPPPRPHGGTGLLSFPPDPPGPPRTSAHLRPLRSRHTWGPSPPTSGQGRAPLPGGRRPGPPPPRETLLRGCRYRGRIGVAGGAEVAPKGFAFPIRSCPSPPRSLPPLCAPYHRRGPAVATRRSTRWAPGDARGAQNAAADGSGDPPGARIRPSGTLPIVSRSPRALLAPSIPDNTVGGPEGSALPRPRQTANRPNSEAERDRNPTAPGEGSAAYRCLHPPSGLGSPAAPALRSRSPRALLSSR